MSDTVSWETARSNVTAMNLEFRRLERRLTARPSLRNAAKLARFAVKSYSSNYYSEVLENFYLGLVDAESDASAAPKHADGILHVLSSSHKSGGHTRIVERWIDSAPAGERHSVILLRQGCKDEIPDLLRKSVVAAKGELIVLPIKLPMEAKAEKLRIIASSYAFIALHHHMDDPVPLMAFGPPGFPRPVIVFNHAGHMFWIGRNATDLLIDIEESQQRITLEKRGIRNSLLVDLPYAVQPQKMPPDRRARREEFGLPSDAFLIVSMASAYKYTPVLEYNFPRLLEKILTRHPGTGAVVIGVTPTENDDWRRLAATFPKRLFLLGQLPHDQALACLQACNLYIDSYPYNSFTALLDGVTAGQMPALSLHTPTGAPRFVKGTFAEVSSQEELMDKVDLLLHDAAQREALHDTLHKRISEMADTNRFQEEVHQAYSLALEAHAKGRKFLPINDSVSDFDVISCEMQRILNESRERIWKTATLELGRKRKGVYHRSLSILGFEIYSHKLENGRWARSICGLKWPGGHPSVSQENTERPL